MHLLDLRHTEPLALHCQIDCLAPGHAKRAARLGQQLDQSQTHGRRGRQCRIACQQLEGQRLQGVAHQNRRGLIVGLVTRRPAAAQIVVIHCRQIIVHERIDVHELDGAGRGLYLLFGQSHGVRGGEQQGRAHPLAAAEHAVAHRLMQACGHRISQWKPRREPPLYARAPGPRAVQQTPRGRSVLRGWHG